MNKNNFKLKESVSQLDKIRAVNDIVASYFTKDDHSEEFTYTPFFSEMAKLISFFEYFSEGLEFDPDETYYEALTSDKQLMTLYPADNTQAKFYKEFSQVLDYVEDIVAFKKLQMVNQSPLTTYIETMNRVAGLLGDNTNLVELLDKINAESE